MLTLKYGPLPGRSFDVEAPRGTLTAERIHVLNLDYPQWQMDGPISLTFVTRTSTTPVAEGAHVQALEDDAAVMSCRLVLRPYLAPVAMPWTEQIALLRRIQGRWVDLYSAQEEFGEWLFHRLAVDMDEFGISPADGSQDNPVAQGLYPREIAVDLRFSSSNPKIR